MKKPFVFVMLAMFIILAGCSIVPEEIAAPEVTTGPEETTILLAEEVPLSKISWVDEPFSGSMFQELYNVVCKPEDRFDDEALQQAVAQIPVIFPIMDEESIHTYAWEFYKIGVEKGLFSSELTPETAMCFSDGVWEIIYTPESVHPGPTQKSYYDGNLLVELLISDVDGQIIYVEINSNYKK